MVSLSNPHKFAYIIQVGPFLTDGLSLFPYSIILYIPCTIIIWFYDSLHMCLTRHQTKIQIQADSYTKQNRYTVEPQYNEPLYNAVLGITNRFLYPSNSKPWKTTSICLRKPRHSEQILPVPRHFAVTLLNLMLGSEVLGEITLGSR